jgi:hypothetical protein
LRSSHQCGAQRRWSGDPDASGVPAAGIGAPPTALRERRLRERREESGRGVRRGSEPLWPSRNGGYVSVIRTA